MIRVHESGPDGFHLHPARRPGSNAAANHREDFLMAHETATRPEVKTVDDLERAGFTAEQIGKLVALRAAYSPVIEQVESGHQWRQLQFLRWLYRQGEYAER